MEDTFPGNAAFPEQLAQPVYDIFQDGERVCAVRFAQQHLDQFALGDHAPAAAQQILEKLHNLAVACVPGDDGCFAISYFKSSEHSYG